MDDLARLDINSGHDLGLDGTAMGLVRIHCGNQRGAWGSCYLRGIVRPLHTRHRAVCGSGIHGVYALLARMIFSKSWGKRRLIQFRAHEPLWVEIWSGLSLIAWACWLIVMSPAFAEREPYQVLAGIAGNHCWAAMAGTCGLAQFFCAIIDCKVARWIMAFFAAWLWFVLGYGLLLGNSSAPGVASYWGWGLADMTSLVLLFNRKGRVR